MERIIIFGNSGSGKSTLAKALADHLQAPHFDLDVIAWKADQPGVRATHEESLRELMGFIEGSDSWIIEGCYSGLLREASAYCTEMIFLNPGIDICIENCRARPWEPHKYPSREAQDANLQMLVEWVGEYETREDEFSLREHLKLFNNFTGKKVEYRSNAEALKRAGMDRFPGRV